MRYTCSDAARCKLPVRHPAVPGGFQHRNGRRKLSGLQPQLLATQTGPRRPRPDAVAGGHNHALRGGHNFHATVDASVGYLGVETESFGFNVRLAVREVSSSHRLWVAAGMLSYQGTRLT